MTDRQAVPQGSVMQGYEVIDKMQVIRLSAVNLSKNSHLGIFPTAQLIHEGMVQARWLFSYRTFLATAQCSTCSFYPLLVRQEEFSDTLKQKLGQPGKERWLG